MPTHKINADLDVDGEVQGTSLDINGAGDISGTLTLGGDVTIINSIIHAGDSNTFFGFHDNDQWRVVTGGTERFEVTNSGSTFSGDVQAAGLYVGATNTSFDFYNNGTSYLNGTTTVDANLSITAGSLSITGDGSNAATLTESASGDFTIATVDDLRLDSGGNDIVLRGASSAEFGRLTNSSQDFVIQNITSNKDIIFKGDDGGATITALTLDMSEGGNATFAGTITLPNSNTLTGSSGKVAFNGRVSGSTPTGTTDFTTKAYVDLQISNLIDSAPGALNTLNELAAALGDDASFSTTVTNSIAAKLPLAGGTMSGDIAMGSNDISGVGTLTATTLSVTNYGLASGDIPNNAADTTGNAASATQSQQTVNCKTTSVSNSAEYFGVFVDQNTNGFQDLHVATGLKYNPSTDVLSSGKYSSETVDIVENAKSNAACMTITGAGAGTEANIGLKIAGTVHGNPIKVKMTAENGDGTGVGAGILSFDPDSDTLNIGQSTTHNSMAMSIDNNEAVSINNRKFAVTSSTDGDFDGDVIYTGSTSTTVGKIYHYKSNGTWEEADANAAANCDGMLAVALGGNSTTNGMLLRGMVTLNHDPGNLGDVLFLSAAATGQATGTAPSGNGDIVRVIGYLLGGSNGQIYFNPDGTFVEVTA